MDYSIRCTTLPEIDAHESLGLALYSCKWLVVLASVYEALEKS